MLGDLLEAGADPWGEPGGGEGVLVVLGERVGVERGLKVLECQSELEDLDVCEMLCTARLMRDSEERTCDPTGTNMEVRRGEGGRGAQQTEQFLEVRTHRWLLLEKSRASERACGLRRGKDWTPCCVKVGTRKTPPPFVFFGLNTR